jgi:cytochrome c
VTGLEERINSYFERSLNDKAMSKAMVAYVS